MYFILIYFVRQCNPEEPFRWNLGRLTLVWFIFIISLYIYIYIYYTHTHEKIKFQHFKGKYWIWTGYSMCMLDSSIYFSLLVVWVLWHINLIYILIKFSKSSIIWDIATLILVFHIQHSLRVQAYIKTPGGYTMY